MPRSRCGPAGRVRETGRERAAGCSSCGCSTGSIVLCSTTDGLTHGTETFRCSFDVAFSFRRLLAVAAPGKGRSIVAGESDVEATAVISINFKHRCQSD